MPLLVARIQMFIVVNYLTVMTKFYIAKFVIDCLIVYISSGDLWA